MPKRPAPPRSRPQQKRPRDHDREGRQPYATEVKDYSQGVAAAPEVQSRRSQFWNQKNRGRRNDAPRLRERDYGWRRGQNVAVVKLSSLCRNRHTE